MNPYLVTAVIENLTPWHGGLPLTAHDASGYTASMQSAVSEENMWSPTEAEELLEHAKAYFSKVNSQRLSRQVRSTGAYSLWKDAFKAAMNALEEKINDHGFG